MFMIESRSEKTMQFLDNRKYFLGNVFYIHWRNFYAISMSFVIDIQFRK